MGQIHFQAGPLKNDMFSHAVSVGHGAHIVFLGVVRDHNHGKIVKSLHYDIFEPLARKSLEEICHEAKRKWGEQLIIRFCHAYGEIKVGETSVCISVQSHHRRAAFEACQYIIDEMKQRAPIWKKEVYESGESEWTQGHGLCEHA